MFRPLILIFAVPGGFAAGLVAWLAAGGPSSNLAQLEGLQAEVAGLRRVKAGAFTAQRVNVAGLAASPLFALTTGPGATPEPSVRLEGVTRTRGRVAALLSVNDGPAEWMTLGDAREGVTLQEVHASRVLVDTVYGSVEVALGARVGPSTSGASAAPPPVPAPPPGVERLDEPPRGFRSPPPPASAPGMPQ